MRQAGLACVTSCILSLLVKVLFEHLVQESAGIRWQGAGTIRQIGGWCNGGGHLHLPDLPSGGTYGLLTLRSYI